MRKYERQISFKTLFLSLIRRFDMFFIALAISTIGSVLASQVFVKQAYYSTASLGRYDSVIKENQYNKTREYIISETTINATAKELEKNSIYHANGNAISINEISEGITVESLATNSIYINLKFESTDKNITKDVLNYLASVTIDQIRSSGDESIKGTKITRQASDPVKSSKNQKLLITGIVAGALISLVLAFLSEIILDEVYDADDINILGSKAYETQFIGEKEKKFKPLLFFDGNTFLKKNFNNILDFPDDGVVYNNIKYIQNEINVNFKAKSICVSSIGNHALGSLFGVAMSHVFKTNDKTNTLVEISECDSNLDTILKEKSKDFAGKLIKIDNKKYFSEIVDSEDVDNIFKINSEKNIKTIIVSPSIDEHDDIVLLKEKVDCFLVVVQKNSTTKASIYRTIQLFKEKGIEQLAFVIVK